MQSALQWIFKVAVARKLDKHLKDLLLPDLIKLDSADDKQHYCHENNPKLIVRKG